jgi:outer membrane receptor protein involved in Fe transport
VTPKVSLQYFITPDNLVYATAAKGFRAGGVNQVLTSAAAGFLANYALTTAQMPKTYESDSVWSYELGGKMRLWEGRAQINASIYDLEWSNMQQAVGAGDTVVFNVPSVRTRGGDLELQVRPLSGLTLNGSVGYIEAEYTSSLIIPGGPGSRSGDLVVAREGTNMPQPAWTWDLGARYDLNIGDFGNMYGRVDYRWTEGYNGAVPGTPGFSPDSSYIPARKNVNLRLGIVRGDLDVNVFALNVTDETAGPRTGGRSQCTNADCSTYTAYGFGQTLSAPTPRQIGVQVAYRMRGQ